MKKTMIFASLALIAAATAGGIEPARAQAAQVAPQAISYGGLKGNYSFSTLGTDDAYYPSAGELNFDGKGHVTGVISAVYDESDVCANMTLVGTYTTYPGYNIGSAQLTLSSVSTGGCALNGDGDTLPVAITIGAGGNTIYLAEMDNYSTGTYGDDFSLFTAVGNHY
jgi:hypothetical protein